VAAASSVNSRSVNTVEFVRWYGRKVNRTVRTPSLAYFDVACRFVLSSCRNKTVARWAALRRYMRTDLATRRLGRAAIAGCLGRARGKNRIL